MKYIFTFLIALTAVAFTSQSQNTWTQKSDFGGTARRGAVGFSIGNKGYIGTGIDINYNYKSDFWAYDPITDTWTQKADFGGTARFEAVGFSIGSKGYIGTGSDNQVGLTKDFWEYDPGLNVWIQKADFGGTARFEAVGLSIGSKGYIGTGNSTFDYYKKDFWEYNPDSNTWAQKADFGGNGRQEAVGFSIGSKGYIGTGYEFVAPWTDNNYRDIWQYDPESNIWTQKADFGGDGRSQAIGFSIGTKGYVGIGLNLEDVDYDYYQDFWEYEPITDSWTQKTAFGGSGRGESIGFSIGGKGYVGTGYYYDYYYYGSIYYNDFWQYTPDSSLILGCAVPIGEITSNITDGSAKLKWNAVPEALGYKVRYKIAGTPEWTNIQSIDNDKTLHGLLASTEYVWQVKSICSTLPVVSSEWSEKQFFTTGSLRSGALEDVSFPIEVDVYPNPFTVSTTISFSLEQTSAVTIDLLDMTGRVVHTLLHDELQSGPHEFTFDREKLPAGIYLLKMQTPSSVMTQSIIVQ